MFNLFKDPWDRFLLTIDDGDGDGDGAGGGGGGGDGGDGEKGSDGSGGEGYTAGDGEDDGEEGDAEEQARKAAEEAGKGTQEPEWVTAMAEGEARTLAARYASPADLAEAGVLLRKQLSTSLTIPGEGATAEELLDFRRKMGVPENASEYEFKTSEDRPNPDLDKRFQEHLRPIFHRANLTMDQVNLLNEGWNKFVGMEEDNAVSLDTEMAEATMNALKQEWGENWDRNHAAADALINDRELASEDLTESLRSIKLEGGRFLLDNANILRFFSRIGLQVLDDPYRRGVTDNQRQGAQEELDGLMKKINEPNAEQEYWNNEAVQKRIAELNEKISGTMPADGRT